MPDIFDPGDAYFACTGPSIECTRVASESFRAAGLSDVLDRIVSNSHLALGDADYRRIEAGLEAAALREISGKSVRAQATESQRACAGFGRAYHGPR